MRRNLLFLLALLLLLAVTTGAVFAQNQIFVPLISGEEPGVEASVTLPTIDMAPGDVILVRCVGGTRMDTAKPTPLNIRIWCRGAAATPVPPTPTPHMDDADLHWHAPGAHGDRPAHEHGDAAPAWVTAAGFTPSFTHVAGTPNENHAYFKHTGFKGYEGRFNGVDWYGIFHLDTNPGGHVNRFHSYQFWFRDGTGAVSHMHGWMNFGDGNNTGPNIASSCNDDTFPNRISPIELGCDLNANFESWYGDFPNPGVPWGPDFGFNIATNYYFSAAADPANPATWTPINGTVRNLERRIEFAWYAHRSNLRGEFWATQFADVVSGPNDAVCGTQRTIGTKTYTVVCLRQYIAPTLTTMSFPGNSVYRLFPGTGVVVLPN